MTVVAQDAETGQVLMVAHADREALEQTLATGEMHYRSRSRGPVAQGRHQREPPAGGDRWPPDCDGDAVLARVVPAGPACHTGQASCFGPAEPGNDLDRLDATIGERLDRLASGAEPGGSYTAELGRNRNKRLKKLGEEAAELVMAAADDDRERTVEEAADLFYHALVVVRAAGGTLADVRAVLGRRRRPPPSEPVEPPS